jgi:hypothetical protein
MKRLLDIYHRKITRNSLPIYAGGLMLVALLAIIGSSYRLSPDKIASEERVNLENALIPSPVKKFSPTPSSPPLPTAYIIPQQFHTFQTFNNCGPASLSMLLSYQGISVGQKELGDMLRPRQHPQGIEDDKSVTIPELAVEAERRGLVAFHRPGGSIQLVKALIANHTPVLVRTWLNEADDIGHYRIIRGFDDSTQELVQDDSLQGQGLRYSYANFEKLWLPFQFEFLVVSTQEQSNSIEQLLGDLSDADKAWEEFNKQSVTQASIDPTNHYHLFNQSIAAFYLKDYSRAVQLYEQVAEQMPTRMLWYQIQPIEAYLQTGNFEKVFELTDSILSGPNKAFSELYLLRGEAYERLGEPQKALREYELALLYNKNLEVAQSKVREMRVKF